MITLNDNFRLLPDSYLFSEVAKRIKSYKVANPGKEIIRMDIGDVTRPLFPCVIEAMESALKEMSQTESFKGYGPEQGYEFLREAIVSSDYQENGINISMDEVFVGDGAKSDLGNLGELFSKNCMIGLMNPAYPAYFDDNVIDGRAGRKIDGNFSNVTYLECEPQNEFIPQPPKTHLDLIYLCFPNNPTGAAISHEDLRKWIEYALKHESVIIYDSAYETFVREQGKVRSIYEIENADRVAIEVRSFSKTAGFTGVRCGYTVVPKKLKGRYSNGEQCGLNSLWLRRQTTKFNGVSYITQKGAFALYSPEGRKCIIEAADYYLRNAELIASSLRNEGFNVFGGKNSPYIWASSPAFPDSWELFQKLIERCNFSVTPGVGFGRLGQGYIRLTGFNTYENTLKAMENLRNLK